MLPCDLWQIKNLVKTVEEMFERYGHEPLKLVRYFEKNLSRFNKVALDIGFLHVTKSP